MRQRSIDASDVRFKRQERDLEKAFELQEAAEDALQEFKELARRRIAIRDALGRGNVVSDRFVRHARTLLSTGGSARSTLEQLHLNAVFVLSAEEYDVFNYEGGSNITLVSVPPRGTRVGKLPIHVDAHSEIRTHPTMGVRRNKS
jgi:hypothetical protein